MAITRPATSYKTFTDFFNDSLYTHGNDGSTIVDLSRIVMTKNMRIDGLVLALPITADSLFNKWPDVMRRYFLKYTNQNSFPDLTQTYYKEIFLSKELEMVESTSEYDLLSQKDGSVVVVERVKFLSYYKRCDLEKVIKPAKPGTLIAETVTISLAKPKYGFVDHDLLQHKVFVTDESTGDCLFNQDDPDIERCYKKSAQEVQEAITAILLPFEAFGMCQSFGLYSADTISANYFDDYIIWRSIVDDNNRPCFKDCSLSDLLRIHQTLSGINWEQVKATIVKERFNVHREINKEFIKNVVESHTEEKGSRPGKDNNLGLQIPTEDAAAELKALLQKYQISFPKLSNLDTLHQAQEITEEVETYFYFQRGIEGALQDYNYLNNKIIDILQKMIIPQLEETKKICALKQLSTIHGELIIELNNLEEKGALKKSAELFANVINIATTYEVANELATDELNDFIGCAQYAINIIKAIRTRNYEEGMVYLPVFKAYVGQFAYGKMPGSMAAPTRLAATGMTVTTGTSASALIPAIGTALITSPLVLVTTGIVGIIGFSLMIKGSKEMYDAKKGQLTLTAENFIKEAENTLGELKTMKDREEVARRAYRKKLVQLEKNRHQNDQNKEMTKNVEKTPTFAQKN